MINILTRMENQFMKTWHYEKNGVRHDNISEDNILSLIKNGTLNSDTLVWQQGMAEWCRLADTSLSSALQTQIVPPQLPANKIPSTVTWILALAPILGYLLECFIAGSSSMSEDAALDAVLDGQYWYVTLILNVALGYLDEWKLKQSGINTEGFGKMAWLVPVYLWQRANHLKMKPVHFWVWIVAFILVFLV